MKLLIIDWFNLVKRCLYTNDLQQVEFGELVDTMTFAILNRLSSAIKNNNPDLVIICSDNGRNTRAQALVSTYKANRKRAKSLTAEEKEKSYIEFIKNVAHTLPCPFIEVKNVEADMIIRCVINRLNRINKDDIDVTIASSDSDFIQLLDKHVRIYDWKKGLITEDNWYTKHQNLGERLSSKNYALAKCIAGDSSDNIPGLSGFGWKKIVKIFTYINTFYNAEIEIDSLTKLMKCLTAVLNSKDDIFKTKGDKKLFENLLLAVSDNLELLTDYLSIIDLNMIETPYLYKIYNEIEANIINNKLKFNKSELIKLMQLGRYCGNDYGELKAIIDKNSAAMIFFYSLAGRGNKAINVLSNRSQS